MMMEILLKGSMKDLIDGEHNIRKSNTVLDEEFHEFNETQTLRNLPTAIKRFSCYAKRKQPGEHDKQVCNEYLQDLQEFVTSRIGNKIELNIPSLEKKHQDKNTAMLKAELITQGWYSSDWNTTKLTLAQIQSAVESMAVLHAAGLAYRMSMKNSFEQRYPWLMEDIYTSNMTKELIARNLDSYLHRLSFLPGSEKVLSKLRKIEQNLFQHLVSLRRPNDALGSRFSTICHGDMWQGNLMFKEDQERKVKCVMLDFHSSSHLSPASDLAHLVLTSCPREIAQENWESIVEQHYKIFNTTLAQFGLILKHLGTSYNHFREEVSRAMAGQFLAVALVIPIVALFGPQEFLKLRRRSSSSDRQNTVRHLIQMMSISEEIYDSSDDDADNDKETIPAEYEMFLKNENLTTYTKDLLQIAKDLDILKMIRPESRPRCGSWDKTKETTAKYKPLYAEKISLLPSSG